MPKEIYLVKVGMNMTEGVVEEWYVPDGGTVTAGELLYRLETEKVNLDVDAEASGTVKHLIGEGVTLEPGDVVGYIFEAGEEIPAELGEVTAASAPAAPARAAAHAASAPEPAVLAEAAAGGRLRASPIARRLAAENGLDLASVAGSGPLGRIVEADVLAAASAAPSAPAQAGPRPSSPMARKVARELGVDLEGVRGTGPGGRITKEDVESAARAPAAAAPARGDQSVPVKGMRKTIARRMHESLSEMAQLTMNMDVVMDEAVKLREQLIAEWQDEGLRPTYTDLVIRAVAKALTKHPLMNASFSDTEMVLHGAVNVGMAVALDEGLIVPVVKRADALSVHDLAVETTRLANAARDGSLGLDDLQGGTFTVSTLGMFGVDSFTPIINAPEVGILGVNRIREDVAWEGDKPVKQQRMTLSLTWDHRALDGAPAARFLSTVQELLEAPYRLLL